MEWCLLVKNLWLTRCSFGCKTTIKLNFLEDLLWNEETIQLKHLAIWRLVEHRPYSFSQEIVLQSQLFFWNFRLLRQKFQFHVRIVVRLLFRIRACFTFDSELRAWFLTLTLRTKGLIPFFDFFSSWSTASDDNCNGSFLHIWWSFKNYPNLSLGVSYASLKPNSRANPNTNPKALTPRIQPKWFSYGNYQSTK